MGGTRPSRVPPIVYHLEVGVTGARKGRDEVATDTNRRKYSLLSSSVRPRAHSPCWGRRKGGGVGGGR